VKSKDKSADVVFYGSKSGDDIIETCLLGQKCKVTEHRPFFLRIHAYANSSIHLQLDYDVEQPASGTVYCSVLAIPWQKDQGLGQMMQVLGGLKFVCRSQALDILGILGFIGCALLAIFVGLGVLHGMKVIDVGDWLFGDGEKKRFDSLKKDPFANDLGDAHPEEGATNDR
jgi:hypothetical protein